MGASSLETCPPTRTTAVSTMLACRRLTHRVGIRVNIQNSAMLSANNIRKHSFYLKHGWENLFLTRMKHSVFYFLKKLHFSINFDHLFNRDVFFVPTFQ